MSTNTPGHGNGPLVRVHGDFDREFPDGSALATECFLNLGRVAMSMLSELDRLLDGFGVPSYTSFNALTVIAGAGEPIPPSVVAKRMVVTRPTVTGLLNTLERLGLITRGAHGSDGRMRLVSLRTRVGISCNGRYLTCTVSRRRSSGLWTAFSRTASSTVSPPSPADSNTSELSADPCSTGTLTPTEQWQTTPTRRRWAG